MKYKFEDIAISSTVKKKPEESDKYHYIGLEHLKPENLFVQKYGSEVAPIGEKLVMRKGDVLFGKRRAYQKKVAIAPCDGIFSAHGMVLRPNESVVNKEYFPFFISSDIFLNEAIRISVGSLSPTINWRDLKELEFDLPPIKEQECLAKLLWAAYELKESYKKLIVATDDMVKAQFIEMFGNIENNKEYKEVLLPDAFTLQMGKTPSRGKQAYWNNGTHKWITISDLNNCDKYISQTKEYISDNALETGIKIIPKDTIIMSFKLTVGVVRITKENMYSNEAIVAFINKNTVAFNFEFLYKQLVYKDWTQNANVAVKGATLNKESLSLKKLIIPPIDKQNKFAKMVQQADKSKDELRQSIEKIDDVMKSLLP